MVVVGRLAISVEAVLSDGRERMGLAQGVVARWSISISLHPYLHVSMK